MSKIRVGVFLLLCVSALHAAGQSANRVERFYLAKLFSDLTLTAKQQVLFRDAAAAAANLRAKSQKLGTFYDNGAVQSDQVIDAILNGKTIQAGDASMRDLLTQRAEAIFKTADKEFSGSIFRAVGSLNDQQIVSLLSLQQQWKAAEARTQALASVSWGKWEEQKESMINRVLAATGAVLYFESPSGSAMIPIMGDTARFAEERNRAIDLLDWFRYDSKDPSTKLAITRAFFASMIDPRTVKRDLEVRVRQLVSMGECPWVLEHLKAEK